MCEDNDLGYDVNRYKRSKAINRADVNNEYNKMANVKLIIDTNIRDER